MYAARLELPITHSRVVSAFVTLEVLGTTVSTTIEMYRQTSTHPDTSYIQHSLFDDFSTQIVQVNGVLRNTQHTVNTQTTIFKGFVRNTLHKILLTSHFTLYMYSKNIVYIWMVILVYRISYNSKFLSPRQSLDGYGDVFYYSMSN